MRNALLGQINSPVEPGTVPQSCVYCYEFCHDHQKKSFTHSAVARWGENTARALRAAQPAQQLSCQECRAALPSVLNSTYKNKIKALVFTNVSGSCWPAGDHRHCLWLALAKAGKCGMVWQVSAALLKSNSRPALRNTLYATLQSWDTSNKKVRAEN